MRVFKSIKYWGHFFVDTTILYLSMLFPRKRNLMIFGAWFGNKYDDNPKYLFEYIYNFRKDLKVTWITSNDAVYQIVKSKNLPVCKSHSWKAIYLSLRARYVITATYNLGGDIGEKLMKLMGGARFINLWHGVPLKKVVFDDDLFRPKETIGTKLQYFLQSFPHRHCYHFATSPEIKRRYISCFRSDDKHVIDLGQARNDYFYVEHKNPYRERFSGKKIIVYMPTHRREGKQIMDMYKLLDLKRINELCEKFNAVFLIKKHFYHRNEPTIGSEFSCIYEITHETTPSQIILDCADILITDYSSCYIDHLLLDRPQIFYCFDLNDYLAHDRGMYEEYKPNIPGPICSDKETLCCEIEDALNGVDKFEDKRRAKRDYYYSKWNQREVSPQQTEQILKL